MASGLKTSFLTVIAPQRGSIPAKGSQTYRIKTRKGVEYTVTVTPDDNTLDPMLTVGKRRLDDSGGGGAESLAFEGDGTEMFASYLDAH